MVSGTNMVKIIVCIFTILFYAQKKQSLWYERHFLGMNDIVITFLYNFFLLLYYIFIDTINLSFSWDILISPSYFFTVLLTFSNTIP